MRYDIALLRVIAILAIVLHHSAGAFVDWPYNIERITELDPVTFHIWKICKMIGLGLFTFISGALLNMQLDRIGSIRPFILKKARRILLPCAVAGIAYEILYPTLYAPAGPLPVIYHTHLWYLPFIFMSLVVTAVLRPTWSWSGLGKIIAVIAVAQVLQPYGWLYQMHIFYPAFIAGYFHKHLLNSKLARNMGGVLCACRRLPGKLRRATDTIHMGCMDDFIQHIIQCRGDELCHENRRTAERILVRC